MKKTVNTIFRLICVAVLFSACSQKESMPEDITLNYPKLLNITHTATENPVRGQGYFTDQGSWMGFTIPEDSSKLNGFCGPFDLDNRRWISQSFLQVSFVGNQPSDFIRVSAEYYPGKAIIESVADNINLTQRLFFVDAKNTLLQCYTDKEVDYQLVGSMNVREGETIVSEGNVIEYKMRGGEMVVVSFPQDVNIELDMNSKQYLVNVQKATKEINVVISYFNTEKEYLNTNKKALSSILSKPREAYKQSVERWNNYIVNNLRTDMPEAYNRIMVKSVMTLMSNWLSPKGALLHEGVAPSHAMGYFVGFWAWDSWKHAVALAHIDATLAKNQIRTMFDYQSDAGMIADCIYTDINENNWRDSKPPLATWAVSEIYKTTGDKEFIAEMYPKLLKYHQWWYKYRDHDNNGICEFGATDGTLEAAKWESGMDNAVRYDDAKMVRNGDGAWSFDQESVDLNAYLCLEEVLLKEMAELLGEKFDVVNRAEQVRDYFFDAKDGYFYDKRIKGDFVREQGPEGWTPLWTKIATEQQAKETVKIMFDTTKFSTYIPFPTVAADNAKFTPNGYWRGPIWLDQVYFAISGLRKYGYSQEADKYTDQVFTRLEGLNEDGAIHENYETSTGKRLKAPHFSWSSAHLFMMYKEYGKHVN